MVEKTSLRDDLASQDFILQNYRSKTLTELSNLTDYSVSVVNSFLRKKRLKANRFASPTTDMSSLLRLSDSDAAYLAGLIDGDGTITLVKRANHHYIPSVSVASTSKLCADYLSNLSFSVRSVKKKNGVKYMHIAISGHQILPILERLLPFLVLKKLQALAVMAFIKHRQNAAFREKPSDRMLELVQIIRDLNIQTNRFKRERDEADKLAKLQSDLEVELKDLSTCIFS